MEIIGWANKEGQLIKLNRDEARELIFILDKALREIVAESGFINTTIEIGDS